MKKAIGEQNFLRTGKILSKEAFIKNKWVAKAELGQLQVGNNRGIVFNLQIEMKPPPPPTAHNPHSSAFV